jgi:hypothetical protein
LKRAEQAKRPAFVDMSQSAFAGYGLKRADDINEGKMYAGRNPLSLDMG